MSEGLRVEIHRRIWCDRQGWPLMRIRGRPILNAIRWLIHARQLRHIRGTVVLCDD